MALCTRSFDLNSRICIYLNWFKERAKERLNEGYEIEILEIPASFSNSRKEILQELDVTYQEDILILEIVDV